MTVKTVDRTFLQGQSAELFRAAIKSQATRDPYERRLIGFSKENGYRSTLCRNIDWPSKENTYLIFFSILGLAHCHLSNFSIFHMESKKGLEVPPLIRVKSTINRQPSILNFIDRGQISL